MELGSGTLLEIRKEAAEWLIEMDFEPEEWDRRGFDTWLRSSPRHMEEFLYATALWRELHKKTPGNISDVQRLVNESGNVLELPRSSQKREQPPHGIKYHNWFARLAACALLFAGASAGLWQLFYDGTTVLTTAIGEQRVLQLADRSVVHLNTDTRIEVSFTDEGRDVRLIQGEALFTVERDVNRPFRVLTDGINVEALGTQFNVRRRASETIISVVEGRVAVIGRSDMPPADGIDASSQADTSAEHQEYNEVTPSRMLADVTYEAGRPAPAGALAVVAAGKQVRVSEDGGIKEEKIENATAWQQRQLVFSNTPLADIAGEVARYNVTPRLQIEGEALQARQINGVFAADDPESLIDFLESEGLSVTRSGDTVIIRSLK